ncbi:cellulase family glycosylhydrolase [Sorangium sp. So ce1097]|uniref:cellulase family glycosylhydrolase n=1 Tax=Sorangium sp. So ce1097 TaxID=3133330 RepID=UPI003F5DDAA0
MAAGLPLFVTEWGTCSASGDGALDLGEAQTWLDFLSANKISWLKWSIVDKARGVRRAPARREHGRPVVRRPAHRLGALGEGEDPGPLTRP